MTEQRSPGDLAENHYFASSGTYEAELERLRLIEVFADPITLSRLEGIGVGPGWSCLEVAATGTEAEARLMELTSAVFLAAGLFTEDLHARTVELMNDRAFACVSLTLFGALGPQTALTRVCDPYWCLFPSGGSVQSASDA